jgi:hypothetical protein
MRPRTVGKAKRRLCAGFGGGRRSGTGVPPKTFFGGGDGRDAHATCAPRLPDGHFVAPSASCAISRCF